MSELLGPDDFADLSDWTVTDGEVRAAYATGDFVTGLRLINAIGDAAEAANHHPDLTLTYPQVTVTLSSHDVGGLTDRDVTLAREITELAAGLGVSSDQG